MVYDPKLRDDGQVIMDKGELENYGAQWLTPLLAGEIRSSYAVTERRVRRHQPVSLDVKVHERADERPAASHGGTT